MTTSLTSAPVLRISAVAGLVLVLAALIAGCGSSSPAKPAYCSDVTAFKTAVGKLKDSGSPSALASNISNVVSTGQAAVSAVKTAFAPQAATLKSSLNALATSAKGAAELGDSGDGTPADSRPDHSGQERSRPLHNGR